MAGGWAIAAATLHLIRKNRTPLAYRWYAGFPFFILIDWSTAMATEQVRLAEAAKQLGVTKHSGVSRFLNQYFYFCMSLLVAVVVIYGFGHTVDNRLVHATPPRPWILWVHGAVFSGWVVFFIFQSALVRAHHVKLHRLTGWFGAALGVLIPVLGIATSIVMARFRIVHFHQAGIKPFFGLSVLDMTSFALPFWLAIYWRKKPEFHRRLVLIATCALTNAAFARFPMMPQPHAWSYAGVDALILLGVARDLIVNRRIHSVYRYALPILIACQIFAVRLAFHHPAWWVNITNTIIG
jgi:Na+-transporting NADH:ubiquinone oxidoreductase subunit NqrE